MKHQTNPHVAPLRKRVAKAPSGPGIYRWMDQKGTVLYVGKAKNLKNRLKSYVQKPDAAMGPWKISFLSQIADFDVTITNSELEALILETNLIKQLKPKYNVLMKDDKNYLYIQITLYEAYPRVMLVRRMPDAKAKYFGPYLNSRDAEGMLEMLQDVYQFRACRESLDALNGGRRALGVGGSNSANGKIPRPTSHAPRPCLEHQIGRCNGLCAGIIAHEEYRRRIDQVIAFLKGDEEPVKRLLREKMNQAASEKKFEQAAKFRNQLSLLERTKGDETLASDTTGEDTDIVGLALLSGRTLAVVMVRRGGKIIGDVAVPLAGQAESQGEVLAQFLPQFYQEASDIPDAVIVAEDFEGREAMEEFLTNARAAGRGVLQYAPTGRPPKKVEILIPERGKKSHLLELAEKNAQAKAHQQEAKWESDKRNTEDALDELQRILVGAYGHTPLPKGKRIEGPALRRIEGYDISHLGGTETVGSMVVMIDGKPANDQYRSFTLRSIKTGEVDDYKSLREVLTRRLRHLDLNLSTEEKRWAEEGITFRKARKADQKSIEDIHSKYPAHIGSRKIDYRQYSVVLAGEDMIGLGRIFVQPTKLLELKSIWVTDAWRGKRLGQFIARKLLRSIKKGKVYVTIVPELEEYYAELGFRYIIKPPPILTKEMNEEKKKFPKIPMGIAMVYDVLQHKTDISLTSKPDLLVMDGGKGQLGVAVEVLQSLHLEIPVIALAKQEEEVFAPAPNPNPNPIPFPSDSPAKFLLMRLRDEAHRFANRHREKRAWKHAIA